jgi:hypothetical protein
MYVVTGTVVSFLFLLRLQGVIFGTGKDEVKMKTATQK